MAFDADFVAIQGYPDTNEITFTDTSVGADANLTERRLYPRNAAGELVLPEGNTLGYILWPLPLVTPLTVNLLQKDLALNIQGVYISSSPLPASIYDITNLFVFTKYTKRFIYDLSQDLAAKPNIQNDTNWVYYYSLLQTECDTAELAGTADLEDISDAQGALDRSKFIMNNSANFF